MQRRVFHLGSSACRRPLTPFVAPCVRRSYQHSSPHAPGPKGRGDPESVLAYSRQDLVSWWHRAARETTPFDLKWEGRDHLEAMCTIIRPDGSVETPETPMSKQEMIDSFGLQPRDLRSLDAHILDVRPSLLVAKRSILVVTPVLRAIVAHDRLVIIGSDPKNPLVTEEQAKELVDSLKEVLRFVGKADTPFEFRALEALLLLTVKGFRLVTGELQARVYALIPQLRFGVSSAELRDLLESKRTVEDCLYSGRALQRAIAAVLSEDEDLAGMYLTDRHNIANRPIQDHQTAELLLEYYERRLDETNEASLRLSSLLSDVDSNITLVLSSTRVRLQNLELQTALTTLSLGAGTALAGFFGMNLHSGFENSTTAFYVATSVGVTSMAAIMVIGWIRLLRARKSQVFLGSALRERQSQLVKIQEGRAIGTGRM